LVVSGIVLIPVGAGDADGLINFSCAKEVGEEKPKEIRWLTAPPQTIESTKRQAEINERARVCMTQDGDIFTPDKSHPQIEPSEVGAIC
jgi:hypothetical protein